jgi:hypothetical protein
MKQGHIKIIINGSIVVFGLFALSACGAASTSSSPVNAADLDDNDSIEVTITELLAEDAEEDAQAPDSYLNGVDPLLALGLPTAPENFDFVHGMVHPFGVVRSGLDIANLGHSGIDLQLKNGAEVLAMADGVIQKIEADQSVDGLNFVVLSIGNSNSAILYEHFLADESLEEGEVVSVGDVIGTFTGGYAQLNGNMHVELRTFSVDDYSMTMPAKFQCWVDFLDDESYDSMIYEWYQAADSAKFQFTWKNLKMFGEKFLNGLLDEDKFPEGPQLCYEQGTDVRGE